MNATEYVITSRIDNMAVGSRQGVTLERGQRIKEIPGTRQRIYIHKGKEMGVILSLTNEVMAKLVLRGRVTKQA